MITACILAVALVAQHAPVQKDPETGVDFDVLSFRVERPLTTEIGKPAKFLVHVQDIDVTVFRNSKTGEYRSEVCYTGGSHVILIDSEHRGGQGGVRSKYVTQDQISYRKVGWDKEHEWYTYEVTVTIPPEEQKPHASFAVALEIKDACPAPWERDRPQYCGAGIIFVDPKI